MKIELDDGFFFGRGLFETIKIVNNKPLFLEEHLNRLNKSLQFFDIKKIIKKEDVYSFLDNNKIENNALKIIVSEKNTIFLEREDPYINRDKNIRLKLYISDVLRNSTSNIVYHKSFNYIENILEKRKYKNYGYDEVLFLNERNEITEGAVSNIFFIKDNIIYTPKVSAGLLKGTMRDFIIKNNNVIESDIIFEELDKFESAFITNSLMGVSEVGSINSINFKSSKKIKSIIKELEKYGF